MKTAKDAMRLILFLIPLVYLGCGDSDSNTGSTVIPSTPGGNTVINSPEIINISSIREPDVIPNFIPLNKEIAVTVIASVDDASDIIIDTGRVIGIASDGTEKVLAERTENKNGNVPPKELQFKIKLKADKEEKLVVAVEAKFGANPNFQRSPSVIVEFSNKAPPDPVSAVLGPDRINFVDTSGKVVNSLPINVNPQLPFIDVGGTPMLRLTTEEAIRSDDLSKVQILSRVHVTPDTGTTESENDEPMLERVSARMADSSGVKWEVVLPQGADIVVPSRPFSHLGDKSLIVVQTNDEQDIEFMVLDNAGTKIFSKTVLNIALVEVKLSDDGRFVGWQGTRTNLDSGGKPLIQVMDTLSDKLWEFEFDRNVDSAWFTDIPGSGFTVFINGAFAAQCTICK